MDVKKIISDMVDKVQKDPNFAKKFKADPIKALEGVLGIDLPDEQLKAVAEGVLAKVSMEQISGFLDSDGDGKPDLGNLGKLSGLFGKK